MSRTSTAQNITVTAASGNTVLSQVAAAMLPGDWVNFGAGGTFRGVTWAAATGLTVFESGASGASGVRTPFLAQMVYDAANQKILVHSGDHNENAQLFIYNEGTHGWVNDHTATWMQASGNAVHGYAHNVFAKGVMYSRQIDHQSLWRWNGYGTTAWVEIPFTVGPGGNISAAGHCYHEVLNRILVHQLGSNPNGVLLSINPDNTSQQAVLSQTLLNPGDPHNFNAYNRISQTAWFGGGNNCLNSWTIDGSGNIQQASTAPFEAGSSNVEARVVPNPANGNFILFVDGTHWYDMYTSSRTFVAKTGNPTAFTSNMLSSSDPANVANMGGVMSLAIFEYGVQVFQKSYARGAPGEMWMHKPTTNYSTVFPLTENPINENLTWISGGVNPPRTNVRTDGVHAFGTMVSQPLNVFPDSIACLANFTSPNQRVTATLYNNAAVSGLEVELVLRCTLTAGTNTGYEVDLVKSSNEVVIVRWNGPDNSFTIMSQSPFTTNVSLADNAVWVAQIVGNIITVTCNGNSVVSNFDVTTAFGGGLVLNSGSPGMGFWCETTNAADPTKFGLRNWTATAL